ncbi:hypothetical protein BGW38_005059, partial [Lunasporangiospora selenospora]
VDSELDDETVARTEVASPGTLGGRGAAAPTAAGVAAAGVVSEEVAVASAGSFVDESPERNENMVYV